MKLTLGFSPCPNDTFIFDALVNHKIDTGGRSFEVMLEDVEQLNEWAAEGRLDITKLSFPAFFRSMDNYCLLQTGGALGKGVGPLLITNKEKETTTNEINDSVIALPGLNTTANLLFSFAYPEAKNKIFMRFDLIEDYVLAHSGDSLGVIIHENRFTYQQKGLHKVCDLGTVWENRMKLPVPLGGIAVKKNMDRSVGLKIEALIRESTAFAFSHYPLLPAYVKQHSQSMEEEVMRRHIDLYVNDYTLGWGAAGKKAILALLEVFTGMNIAPPAAHENIFIS